MGNITNESIETVISATGVYLISMMSLHVIRGIREPEQSRVTS